MNTLTAQAVVVTYNSAGQIAATLNSLISSGLEVIVVDNASTDATTAIVKRDFTEVHLLANATNAGFAKAVNQALATVSGEVVLLVNPDCTLPSQTTAGLLNYLADQSDVGLVGPKLIGADGQVAISAHPFETLTSVLLSRFGGSLVPVGIRRLLSGARRRATYDACRDGDAPASVDWLSGACLAVRTDLLKELGGLDERYFMYYEDEELCWQAHARGKDVRYLPDLIATHIGGASAELGTTWPHLYRSMLVFFGRHRRSSYQAVRFAILVRAGIGVLLATGRRLARDPSSAGRTTAWRAVASIALRSSAQPDGVAA
jgi:N-acetylglucosaminyl-diphospho-decaprenol L-rhamnosyltransferase